MFHVLSLQRTASKSLVSSLSLLIRSKRVLLAGEPLAEFLHCWSLHDFQFACHLTKPFGHQEDVVFYKTHPKFNHPSNIQFEYVRGFSDDESYSFEYSPVPVVEGRSKLQSFIDALGLLNQLPAQPNFVLKTQLAHFLHSLSLQDQKYVLVALKDFHERHAVTTIKLRRRSGLDWLCSMALTDASGVFIPCKAQTVALDNFVQSPLVVDKSKVEEWVEMWNTHETEVTAENSFFDTDLARTNVLKTRRSRSLVVLPRSFTVPLEFSAVDYTKTISNYDYLQHVSKTLMTRGDE